MPRLAWLGYSGNPVCAEAEARALSGQVTLTQILWASLQLKQKLGEGASGVIYQAALADASREVAVKVFKGALTSDGLPHSEIAAYVSAGSHPYLINLLGKVNDHPDGTQALIMQLVDPSYRNLAAPPSLQSCTRDVYADGLRFSLHDALHVACGVASLARQLHSRGLTHGDLYAHNTLIGAEGHAVLGDFGAAAFYDRSDSAVAQALEQIEVRAFGCLFEELLERVDRDSGLADQQRAALQAAQELCAQCFAPLVKQRPLFKTIEQRLASLIKQM